MEYDKDLEEVEIRGEYWVQNGSVDFADGDVGDTNHVMIATEHVVGQYADEVDSLCDEYDIEHDEFDGNGIDTEAVSKALWRVYEVLTTGMDPDDEDEQKAPRDPITSAEADKLMLEAIGCNEEALEILMGRGDPRKYCMKYENWIAIRSHQVEVYGYTNARRNEIGNAVQDVIYEELQLTDDQYDPETVDISVYDLKAQRSHGTTLAALLAPEMKVANPGVQFTTGKYTGKLTHTASRPDTQEEIPQAKKNKSVPNKWNKAAIDQKVIPPGHELWRGTSEHVIPFSEWLQQKHPDYDC